MRFIFADFQKNRTTHTSTGEVTFNAKGVAPVSDQQAATFLSIPDYREVNEDGGALIEKKMGTPPVPLAPSAGLQAARKDLIARAKELGLRIPGNAKAEAIEFAIATKEKEAAEARAEEDRRIAAEQLEAEEAERIKEAEARIAAAANEAAPKNEAEPTTVA